MTAGVGVVRAVVAILILTAVILSTVALPVFAYAAFPNLVGGALEAARLWLLDHSRPLTVAAGLILGPFFIVIAAEVLL